MNYEEPRLAVVERAAVLIQGGKDDMATSDAEFLRSVPAYQADE